MEYGSLLNLLPRVNVSIYLFGLSSESSFVLLIWKGQMIGIMRVVPQQRMIIIGIPFVSTTCVRR